MISYTDPIFNMMVVLLLAVVYVYPVFCKRGLVYRHVADARLNFWFFLIVVTLFCTFSFSTGDFFNYEKGFRMIVRTGRSGHFEGVYVWLVNHITHTYLVWRLIIWGSTTYVTLIAFRRLSIPAVPAYAAITVFFLSTLYVMRGNLGVAIMFYGLTLLFVPFHGKKHLSYVLGVLLIGVSYFFHKSMILSLVLLLVALIDIDRRKIRWSIYLFPVAVVVMRYLLQYMGDNGLESMDERISSYSRSYANAQQFVANTNGLIAYFFTYGAAFYTIYYAYKVKLVEQLPRHIRFFYNYWYIWVYMAAACYFQEIGGWYFSRFMYMSTLPWAVFMAYIYARFPNSKSIKVITAWEMLGVLYLIAHSIYKHI